MLLVSEINLGMKDDIRLFWDRKLPDNSLLGIAFNPTDEVFTFLLPLIKATVVLVASIKNSCLVFFKQFIRDGTLWGFALPSLLLLGRIFCILTPCALMFSTIFFFSYFLGSQGLKGKVREQDKTPLPYPFLWRLTSVKLYPVRDLFSLPR